MTQTCSNCIWFVPSNRWKFDDLELGHDDYCGLSYNSHPIEASNTCPQWEENEE